MEMEKLSLLERIINLGNESKYKEQANLFLKETNTTMSTVLTDKKSSWGTNKNTVYEITLKNNKGRFIFDFTQSVTSVGIDPNPYDVLACLTNYDVGTFEDFCNDFGYDSYDEDELCKNKKSVNIYKLVCNEYKAVCNLFTDDLIKVLQEIN